MPAFTVQQIIDRAKAAADMHDNFVTDSVWMYWLNQERYALELLMAHSGWPLDYESQTVTVTGDESDGEFALGDITTSGLLIGDIHPAWRSTFTDVYLRSAVGSRLKVVLYDAQANSDVEAATLVGNTVTVYFDMASGTSVVNDLMNLIADWVDYAGTPDTDQALNTVLPSIEVGAFQGDGRPDAHFANSLLANKLPITFYLEPQTPILALVAVHQVKDGRLKLLKYNDAVTFLRQSPDNPQTTSAELTFYRLKRMGDSLKLSFYPHPAVGTEILVTYIPAHYNVNELADKINYPLGWEELIVLGMARRALIKEESDPSEMMRLMGEMRSDIEKACWNRVQSEAPGVRNTDGLNYGRSDGGIPALAEWYWL